MRDKIKALIKLELFSVCIKDNTQVFPSIYDFLCANELKLTDDVKCDIVKHPSELDVQLRRYFSRKKQHKQLDSLSLSSPASSPLTDI